MKKQTALLSLLLLTLLWVGCKETDPQTDPNHHLRSVGASANELLAEDVYSRLYVEIVYVEGYAPTTQTITNLQEFLDTRLHKSGGITIRTSEVPSPGLAPYSMDDVRQMEAEHRTAFTEGDQLTAFLFITDGDFADNSNVLGVAYRNTSMAMFGSKVDAVSGGIGQPSTALLETTVLNHEFAHIMGLVDTGTPLQTNHRDEAHGSHCDVEECLMYWIAETGDVVSNLLGMTEAPGLDPQCIADLQANGGK